MSDLSHLQMSFIVIYELLCLHSTLQPLMNVSLLQQAILNQKFTMEISIAYIHLPFHCLCCILASRPYQESSLALLNSRSVFISLSFAIMYCYSSFYRLDFNCNSTIVQIIPATDLLMMIYAEGSLKLIVVQVVNDSLTTIMQTPTSCHENCIQALQIV